MDMFERMATLRNIIIAKVMILAFAWLMIEGQIFVGDQDSLGQNKVDSSVGGRSGAGSESNAAIAEAEENPAVRKRSRKGFLDGLLQLPSIAPDEVKREELGRYLSLVERKERQVNERLDLLGKREETLKSLEKSVEEKLKRLEDERRFFAETVQKEKEFKDQRTKALGEFYAKMKPKVAAPIFEKLDRDLVVELFQLVPQKQVMEILAAMNPEESVRLSEYYGRVRSGREYEVMREMNTSLQDEFQKCKGVPSESH